LAELRATGIVTRRRTLSTGRTIGGVPFTKGPLAWLLGNRTYLGEINHKDRSYPGEHEAIIEPPLFAAVQVQLQANRNNHRQRYAASEALLLRLLFDDRGNRMTPSTANKKGMRYRYYISSRLVQGRKAEAGSVSRVSASDIETPIIQELRTRFPEDAVLDERELLGRHLERVTISTDRIDVELRDDGEASSFSIPWTRRPTKPHREILGLPAGSKDGMRPMRAENRTVLIRSIAQGRRWLVEIVAGTAYLNAMANREECSRRHVEQMVSLAFLDPHLVKAIVDGRLPHGTNLRRLIDPPLAWSAQWRMLGLNAPR
jgi:hypothetical protein